ncbi:12257_t:CDS:2, partial [Gigaspora rosea]
MNNNTKNYFQEALQAILALATNLNPSSSSNDQHTYVNISAKSTLLFAVGQRDPQQPSSNLRPLKRRKEELEGPEPEETLEQLIEEENRREAWDKDFSKEIWEEYEKEELEERIYGYEKIA